MPIRGVESMNSFYIIWFSLAHCDGDLECMIFATASLR
jgi:hypothetical protein